MAKAEAKVGGKAGSQDGSGGAARPTPDPIGRLKIELTTVRQALTDEAMDRSAAIHRGRRRLKRARSLMVVLKPLFGDSAYREHVRTLKRAGKALSDARDADVMLDRAKSLIDSAEPETASACRAVVQGLTDLAGQAHTATPPFAAIIGDLDRVMAAAHALPTPLDPFGLVVDALVEAYRAGRRDLKRVLGGASDEEFHAWRKRVKHRWHLTMILLDDTEATRAGIAAELDRMAETLGADRDFALLEARLTGSPGLAGGRKDAKAVLKLIKAERKTLRRRAMKLADRLYGARTRDFAKSVVPSA
jgi:CHAD domain-containing protein